MFFPIRCFTCGSVIADLHEDYDRKVKEGQNPARALDDLGVERYCCRRMFIAHVDVVDKIIKYNKL
ncbi:DNA-directed RNA polymerase subunit N [Candidatus Parvarchaeota archaeon]|nr:DNA-directed RNA polymerase subunit N [Candidatus Parvarchaeota archaeon]